MLSAAGRKFLFIQLGAGLLRQYISFLYLGLNDTFWYHQENNGWIEAAINSATRNLVNMWPEAYEREFGEGKYS